MYQPVIVVYIDYDVPGWFFGKESKRNIKEKNPTELINKSTQKNKLNRYTEFFRSFAGNEITPVDSSLIGIITRSVRHTTIALHSLFVSLTTLVKHHCCSVLHFEYYSRCICVDTNSDWCDNIIQDAYVLIKIPIGVIIFVIFNRS
jgi:hypothetical protein